MKYGKHLVETHKVWRHIATGGIYYVFGLARCSTNGERDNKEESVVYFSMTHQGLRYREVSEFLDGRFEPYCSLLKGPVEIKDTK